MAGFDPIDIVGGVISYVTYGITSLIIYIFQSSFRKSH